MEFTDISQQNPWWKTPSEIHNDSKIKDCEGAKVQWNPRIRYFIKFDADRIYTLRGPRQVGKTTLVKNMIKDLLDSGIESKSIFYCTCDLIDNEKDFVELINVYLDWASAFQLDRKYLFLDEISSVKNWEKGLKYLVDTGKLKNTTILLTGSHAIDLKYSIERLPGRRGEGDGTLNKILLPMKFAEFAETVDPSIKDLFKKYSILKSERRQEIIFGLFDNNVDPVLDLLRIHQSDLDRLLEQYLITGGIPKPINEFYAQNRIDNSTYEIYIRSLLGDLAKWNVQEASTKKILRSVSNKLTTTISWQSIVKDSDIGSHNTVAKYIDNLENSFVLNTLYQLDIAKKTVDSKKEKKVYFQDPFIFHSLRAWVSGQTDYFNSTLSYLEKPENKGNLIESIVGNHLTRFMYSVNPSDVFAPHEHIFYWRKKGGKKEVDFVIKDKKGEFLGIEVKYQNTINPHDYIGLNTFKKGILISKKEFNVTKNYVTIPVSLFLLLI